MGGYVKIQLSKYYVGLCWAVFGTIISYACTIKITGNLSDVNTPMFQDIIYHKIANVPSGCVLYINRCPQSCCPPPDIHFYPLPAQSPGADELQMKEAASYRCFSLRLYRRQMGEIGSNHDWVCCAWGSPHWGSSPPPSSSPPNQQTLEAGLQPFS